MTLVEQVWKKVDEDMLELMQPGADTDMVKLKARLRAFAEVLAIFMVPHFTTPDEVAREAKKRYDHRHDDEYETAGLNQRRYEPPPSSPNKYTAPVAKATPSPAHKLTADAVAQIKHFAANGFPYEALARAHGVSAAVIAQVVSS